MVSGLLEPLQEIAEQFAWGGRSRYSKHYTIWTTSRFLVAEYPCSQSKFWLQKKLWRITFGISCIFINVIEILTITSGKKSDYYPRCDNVRSGLDTGSVISSLCWSSPLILIIHHCLLCFTYNFCCTWAFLECLVVCEWPHHAIKKCMHLYLCLYIWESILFPFAGQEVTR